MKTSKTPQHFLSLLDLSSDELNYLINRACELKKDLKEGSTKKVLAGKVLAMIFEKSSTRTRVSFEAGMVQLGGSAMFLSPRDTQLGRGEPIEDTAKVLCGMVDAVMIRTFEHENIELFAEHSSVPVINGLTDMVHPCQLLADMQTYLEHRGPIKGKTVSWIGDGNNMCHSYINAACQFDFELNIACPEGYEPEDGFLNMAGDKCHVFSNPNEAAKNSDLIVTDTWISMGQEEEQEERKKAFKSFRVTSEIMALAKSDALFMHCLPAYRGKEVDADVIDSASSVVWDEAHNRMHAQKALLEFLLT
tara:strand:- start:55714 stop:56628 length:915 start_codon:yes stop_codon:yes gene_type:complete